MLLPPLEEDSLLFRRRVRIELPRLALHAPATPLSAREFKQRRQALLQQAAALQQELAATPRRSPRKRRQDSSVGSSKKRLTISPSPSPCPSPTSSVEEVIMMRSPEETEEGGQRNKKQAEEEESGVKGQQAVEAAAYSTVHVQASARLSMSDSMEAPIPRPYSLPIGVLRRQMDIEEKLQHRQEEANWEQVVNPVKVRGRELPTLSSRSPVQSLDADIGGHYSGASEAAMRLETLISSRRRRRASSPQVAQMAIPSPTQVTASSPVPNMNLPILKGTHTQQQSPPSLEQIDKSVEMEEKKEKEEPIEQQQTSAPLEYINESVEMREGEGREDEEEDTEKPSDFAAFCASFATGGAAAARQISEKRKYHQAFETDEEQPREKTPRIVRRISFSDEVEALAASPVKDPPIAQSNGKRKHQQAFGMIEEIEDDDDAEWRSSLAFRPQQLG